MRLRRWISLVLASAVVVAVAAISALALSRDRNEEGCLSEAPRPLPAFGKEIESVQASSSQSGRIYVTTASRRFYVGERGKHWEWRELATRSPGRLYASVGKEDRLFAASNALFRSADQGSRWRRLTCGLSVTDVALSPSDAKTIYLATAQQVHGPRGGGLYRSGDAGQSWKRLTSFPPPYVDQGSVEVVALDPARPRTVYVAREFGGVDYSRDGGDHWRFTPIAKPGNGTDGPQVTSIALGPDIKTLWVGSRFRGVFVGNPRDGWTPRGLSQMFIVQVLPDSRLTLVVYAVADGRVFRTADRGAHWKRMRGLPRGVSGITRGKQGGTLYAWTSSAVFSSRDHGQDWARLPALPSR
jgi:photosystem II stability/assembly factor-like uncharacterized protein